MMKNKGRHPIPGAERPTSSASKSGPDEHDSQGTPFKRVPGPGPKDASKGAAGAEAIERVKGGPGGAPDDNSRGNDQESDDDSQDKE
jgi:hypothetical protein